VRLANRCLSWSTTHPPPIVQLTLPPLWPLLWLQTVLHCCYSPFSIHLLSRHSVEPTSRNWRPCPHPVIVNVIVKPNRYVSAVCGRRLRLAAAASPSFGFPAVTFLLNCRGVVSKKGKGAYSIAVNGFPSHSYGTSPAIWDHTVLPATRHKWTRPHLNPSQ